MRISPIALMGLSLGLLVGATGCKKEGCTDPAALNYDPDAKKDDGSCQYNTDATLKLHFHPDGNGAVFQYGNTYTNWEGRGFDLDIAQFFVSNITLLSATGNYTFEDFWLLVSPDQHVYSIADFPPGDYTGLSFQVGVDTITNNTKLPADFEAGHVLANTDMHWSWNDGYIFAKFEGHGDTSAVVDSIPEVDLIYHLGTNALIQDVSINYPFTASDNEEVQLNLKVEYPKFFDNVDFPTDFTSHTTNNMPVAAQIMANIPAAISKL